MNIYAGWTDIQNYISNLPIGGKILFACILALIITLCTCLGIYIHNKRRAKLESKTLE